MCRTPSSHVAFPFMSRAALLTSEILAHGASIRYRCLYFQVWDNTVSATGSEEPKPGLLFSTSSYRRHAFPLTSRVQTTPYKFASPNEATTDPRCFVSSWNSITRHARNATGACCGGPHKPLLRVCWTSHRIQHRPLIGFSGLISQLEYCLSTHGCLILAQLR